MMCMRTPDSDDSDSGDSTGAQSADGAESESGSAGFGSLAEGFDSSGSDDPSGSGTDDDAFGTGWSTDPDDASYVADDQALADDEALGLQQDELSAFEFDTEYVPDTDTDWDITGDGVIDGADLHEAATSVSDFHVDPADAHEHHHHHDGGGFFDA